MFYVVAIQVVVEEVVKSPTDADQRMDVLLLVQVFNDLDHDLIKNADECHCRQRHFALLISRCIQMG